MEGRLGSICPATGWSALIFNDTELGFELKPLTVWAVIQGTEEDYIQGLIDEGIPGEGFQCYIHNDDVASRISWIKHHASEWKKNKNESVPTW